MPFYFSFLFQTRLLHIRGRILCEAQGPLAYVCIIPCLWQTSIINEKIAVRPENHHPRVVGVLFYTLKERRCDKIQFLCRRRRGSMTKLGNYKNHHLPIGCGKLDLYGENFFKTRVRRADRVFENVFIERLAECVCS